MIFSVLKTGIVARVVLLKKDTSKERYAETKTLTHLLLLGQKDDQTKLWIKRLKNFPNLL